jgi:hypothetical protein
MAKSTSQSVLERNALEGDSPVDEVDMLFLKRVGLLELEV